MKCPFCNSNLRRYNYNDTTIDICRSCGGSWFDPDELKTCIEFLLQERKDIPEPLPELNKEITKIRDLAEEKRPCPKCNIEMGKLNYSYDSNIILDKCSSCRGIWVDSGELYKLAMHLKGNPHVQGMASGMLDQLETIKNLEAYAATGRALKSNAAWAIFYPKIILPIGDSIRSNIFPFMQLGIILLNIFVFIIQSLFLKDPSQFFGSFGFVPANMLTPHGIFSLFSSGFIHADIFHLAGNMLFLWIFADNIEGKYGHIKFLIFYLFCILGANLFHFLLHMHSDIPTIGASGAVSGVLGAYFIFFPHAKVKTLIINKVIDIPAALYLGAWIACQLLMGIVYLSLDIQYGIGWFAHIGGFITGIALAWGYKKKAP